MKKFSIIIIAASLMMAACANSERKAENQSENQNETKEMKTLVAYFSASGVTRGVATQLAEVAGADLYEIVPEQIYTDADLDWRDSLSRSSVEMKDKSSRPAIKKSDLNINDYSTIYVGFPIWWYTCPTIINTFMETYDFAGKTVIPFATSGSSSIEQACSDLKSAYPKANWKEGRLLNNATKEQLEEWVKSLQ
ncbi:MAG: NAD(P)H-dependent oxidoreductase [Bacteroidales bacterium]|nr:NAD(P)H-dependent oxidoreductase [Bacteroidales bacterium]MBQ6276017.1 NAD(P)H-dependent oxidoreductase [Bacteroidales bacterium]